MKKILSLAALLVMSMGMMAQDTYINNSMVNSMGDIYGTSRYVGMGGAMGALGGEMSTMTYNPAGIGLCQRSDLSLTFGALWNNRSSATYSNSSATIDQAGFVFARPNEGGTSFVFGFNYQKKLNFNHSFNIFGAPLGGLSQMDQLAELVNAGFASDNNLAGLALDPYYDKHGSFDKGFKDSYLSSYPHPEDPSKVGGYYNEYNGEAYDYGQVTWGSMQAFDLDFAFNVDNRAYFGLDLSFDNLDYHCASQYSELSSLQTPAGEVYGDYSLYNDHKVTGWGFNLKLGAIVRPFEDNAFRMGFAIETPTWYRLQNSTLYQLCDDVSNRATDKYESYLRYRLTTPWRFRFSMGSTIGRYFAWDIDYELANWANLKQRIGYDGYTTRDYAMNDHAKQTLRTMHHLRLGVEAKPTSAFALRAGYNFVTSPMNSEAGFDQYGIDSPAMDYCTTTSYAHLKPTHMITLGLGYRGKTFYADLAYKIRSQKADFYAFDSNFASEEPFVSDVPELAYTRLAPVEVDRTTHQITATVGFKF